MPVVIVSLKRICHSFESVETTLFLHFSDPKIRTFLSLIWNFCHVLNVVFTLLGDSPASEFYVPKVRNALSCIFLGSVSRNNNYLFIFEPNLPSCYTVLLSLFDWTCEIVPFFQNFKYVNVWQFLGQVYLTTTQAVAIEKSAGFGVSICN